MIVIRKKHRAPSERGFSLLEMIVAITLVAMMAVGLWAVFRISIRSWSRGTQFIDTNQRHRSVLDMVRKQIASTYGLMVPIDLETRAVFFPIFMGTEDSLTFISLNSLQFQESPGLTLVTYEVAQDSMGEYSLVEREESYLGALPDQQNPANQGRIIPIFENLSGCTFEYFDPGTQNNPPRWVRDWDAQKEGKLPLAVSMTMISRDPEGNALSRHMVIPIQAQINDPRANIPVAFGSGRVERYDN